MDMPHSFAEVIGLFGGPAAFSRETAMPLTAAKQAHLRDSLNARWFSATARAAERKGLPVDERILARIAEQRAAG